MEPTAQTVAANSIIFACYCARRQWLFGDSGKLFMVTGVNRMCCFSYTLFFTKIEKASVCTFQSKMEELHSAAPPSIGIFSFWIKEKTRNTVKYWDIQGHCIYTPERQTSKTSQRKVLYLFWKERSDSHECTASRETQTKSNKRPHNSTWWMAIIFVAYIFFLPQYITASLPLLHLTALSSYPGIISFQDSFLFTAR